MQFHTSGVFHRARTNIPNISMESQKTPNTHSNLEKEERSWGDHATKYQTKPQSRNIQNSIALA